MVRVILAWLVHHHILRHPNVHPVHHVRHHHLVVHSRVHHILCEGQQCGAYHIWVVQWRPHLVHHWVHHASLVHLAKLPIHHSHHARMHSVLQIIVEVGHVGLQLLEGSILKC